MSASNSPRRDKTVRRLPVRPSEEHLRKQAKRLAKAENTPLATAQHRLATDYGARDWAELMRIVAAMNSGADQLENVKRAIEPLPKAVRSRDVDAVQRILASGQFTPYDLDAGLAHAAWYGGDAPDVLTVRKQLFDLLLDHGADPDGQYGSAYGPIVFGTGECLSPDGLQWLLDAGCDVTFPRVETKYGPTCPMDTWLGTYARGDNAAKHRGIDLLLAAGALLPPGISPPLLAIHRGDADALARLLDLDAGLLDRRFPDMPYGNLPLTNGTLLHCAVEFGEDDCIELLLRRGAKPNLSSSGGITPLHRAAHNGPLAAVERLLRAGAREWIADDAGKLPRDYAAASHSPDRDAMTVTLTRPVLRDPHFKAAVAAIHAGDLAALKQGLADHPNLSRDRATEPDCYPPSYFSHPKLLWFVAFNPTLSKTMPANIAAIAEAIIDAGVDADDLAYTLELVMTSDPARQQGHQAELMDLLRARGAAVTPHAILVTLGHGEREPIERLLRHGQPMTAAIAAGLGKLDVLPGLLADVDAETLHDAFSMAVINNHPDAAAQCLAAGAQVNRPLRVHAHSTALHHAAGNNQRELIRLLLAHGADPTIRDTLWNAAPRQWAEHGKHTAAASLIPSPDTPAGN